KWIIQASVNNSVTRRIIPEAKTCGVKSASVNWRMADRNMRLSLDSSAIVGNTFQLEQLVFANLLSAEQLQNELLGRSFAVGIGNFSNGRPKGGMAPGHRLVIKSLARLAARHMPFLEQDCQMGPQRWIFDRFRMEILNLRRLHLAMLPQNLHDGEFARSELRHVV